MAEMQPTTPEQIARTPTGEIAEPGSQVTTTSETVTEKKVEPTEKKGETLLTEKTEAEKEEAAKGAPEKYEPYTLPEGLELDTAMVTEFNTVAKDLGLDQASAQRLVDFHVKTLQAANEAPLNLWKETQEKWVAEVKADPKIGGKLDQVKSTISKAIDSLGELAEPFREAMNFTGAGNNPAFIRALYAMAQRLTEGTLVSGGGPSPHGQGKTGVKPMPAQAMYPNLPSAAG